MSSETNFEMNSVDLVSTVCLCTNTLPHSLSSLKQEILKRPGSFGKHSPYYAPVILIETIPFKNIVQ